MRIVHVIVGLGDGGAERSLYKIVVGDSTNDHFVISLTSRGKYGPLLSGSGADVVSLGFGSGNPFVPAGRLLRIVREIRPDIVHGWMPHGALVSTLLKRILRIKRIFWSFRSSEYGHGWSSLATNVIVRILAALSRTEPSRILMVGHAALKTHTRLGFSVEKMVVIPNGYEVPSDKSLGSGGKKTETLPPELSRGETRFGMVARYHPKKGHKVLLEALSLLKKRQINWVMDLVGEGVSENNQELVAEIARRGLTDLVRLLGPVENPEKFYDAIDFHILPSVFGEGFPNVVAESMLAGVPNIVSSTGDSALIVGDTGWAVAPSDPGELLGAIQAALHCAPSERQIRGIRAKKRILQEFSLQNMVDGHAREYEHRSIAAFPRYSRLGASSRVRMFQFEDALVSSGWNVTFHSFSDDLFLRSRYEGHMPWKNIIFSYWRRFWDLRKSKDADILWAQKELFPWVPAWIEKSLTPSQPLIVYDFDDAVHEQFREHRQPIIRQLLSKKIPRVAKSASGVVVGNQTLKAYFADEIGIRCQLVPSVVDVEKQIPRERSVPSETGHFVFGWIGTPVTFRAYVADLVDEFELIARKLKGEFWVIGAGEPRLSTSHVKYFSWSLREEMRLLESLDVGIMPLTEDPWSRGKCGYKLVQYMAAGKAVVASPVGVNREIVSQGRNGFLVQEAGDWAKYLGLLEADKVLRSEMGRTGLKIAQSAYSLDLAGPEVAQFFRQLVDPGPHSGAEPGQLSIDEQEQPATKTAR